MMMYQYSQDLRMQSLIDPFTDLHHANDQCSVNTQQQALQGLENGKVIFLPNVSFSSPFLKQALDDSKRLLHATHKNISYYHPTQRMGTLKKEAVEDIYTQQLQSMLGEYANYTKNLIDNLFPSYSKNLEWGRTSFRPCEIEKRGGSKRKDDTRLHVDSFSASPVYGKRILRVFNNINRYEEPRIWHLGEKFEEIVSRYGPGIPRYNYLVALFLRMVRTTKTLRSPYDHYQIYLHDRMKRDNHYQHTVEKERFEFPAHSTWLVFTDQVSHAALQGQGLLEQTFYLPVSAMQKPELSPLRQWEKLKGPMKIST